MILLKICIFLQFCTASIICEDPDSEVSSLSSPTKLLSRQKRFPALGFLTFAFSLLNTLLLLVQNVMVREVFSQITQCNYLLFSKIMSQYFDEHITAIITTTITTTIIITTTMTGKEREKIFLITIFCHVN